ncbi:hypothetical protein BDN72DRAFT_887303 [Pluteus cervinus]|uniref:Uncharacterized protein n=1 Tax=Pluteus cervinus TaxID=181527 RepID=A0ACD3B2M2_9AGAR|nr:hypothetical protein BDN72DRAFT_887303 [Pluteus cervinus]
MSHFNGDQQRPAMRRKSSAQNLLSSFKSNNAATAVPAPINTSTISSATGLAYANGAATPTATTPFAKDWDAQSLHSDTVSQAGLPGVTSPSLGQGTSVEYLRDLVQKRIITLTYLRNVHEGRSHWFHTILISRVELEERFNNSEMKKRTYRFAILGMSLSTLLDINQPNDLLRGLLNVMSEFDQAKEDGDKPKIRQSKRLFRPKTAKRQVGGFGDYLDSDSYLVMPHMPYPLDYHQTLLSLLDVLSEVYNKISKILGPSPLHHSTQHMMGPLGLLSPHPGVSYLFSDGSIPGQNQLPNPPPYNTGESDPGSLWGIANAGLGSAPSATAGGGFIYPGTTPLPPTAWASQLADMVLKIDGKFKKMIGMLLKDLDEFARKCIADEISALGPMLRNLDMPGDSLGFSNRPVYEVDGM